MVKGLLISACVLIAVGLAMLWVLGPGWLVLEAGLVVLLVAAARIGTRG